MSFCFGLCKNNNVTDNKLGRNYIKILPVLRFVFSDCQFWNQEVAF